MLMLTRNIDQQIEVGDTMITYLKRKGGQITLRFESPQKEFIRKLSVGSQFMIDGQSSITYRKHQGNQITVAIDAPQSVQIVRPDANVKERKADREPTLEGREAGS